MRSTSLNADGMSERSARTSSHWSGCLANSHTAAERAFTVVSIPAHA